MFTSFSQFLEEEDEKSAGPAFISLPSNLFGFLLCLSRRGRDTNYERNMFYGRLCFSETIHSLASLLSLKSSFKIMLQILTGI